MKCLLIVLYFLGAKFESLEHASMPIFPKDDEIKLGYGSDKLGVA
jgi:hypothetical protein